MGPAGKRVYGPVPSRRFGLSLGVDLLPRKTCVYDCVYCQVGPTTCQTTLRQDFYPVQAILDDVREALQRGAAPQVITLAGSGEPTLYRSLGALIDGLRTLSPAKIVLLTKGSLFGDPGVADEVRHADMLVPSLDAGDQETFRRVNQPHPEVHFDDMLRGLREVCANHPGTVRLEVMLARDLNDSEESIGRITTLLSGIRAETIEINTPVRPAPGRNIAPCDPATLERARLAFGDRARIVGGYQGPQAAAGIGLPEESLILETLRRRPCTLADLHAALGIPVERLETHLETLLRQGKVQPGQGASADHYCASPVTGSGSEPS